MSKSWSPFDEGEYKLLEYDYFFPRQKVAVIFGDHPQVFEDWLGENCPNNYCYIWVWDREYSKHSIVDDLVAVPEDIAFVIKLMTVIDFSTKKDFYIRDYQRDKGRIKYEVCSINVSKRR